MPGRRREPVELRRGDQRRRAAADAVEERHHLRHRGHLHQARRGDADHRADRDAGDDQPVGVDLRARASVKTTAIAIPTAAMQVPGARRRRRGEALDPDDEEDAGDEVGEVDRRLRDARGSLALLGPLGLRLNISSMRSVTRKPPTTLIVAKTTATKRERLLERRVGRAGDEHRADEDDAVDRVRPRHERRVQQRRHARDELEAEEDGEDEDGDAR